MPKIAEANFHHDLYVDNGRGLFLFEVTTDADNVDIKEFMYVSIDRLLCAVAAKTQPENLTLDEAIEKVLERVRYIRTNRVVDSLED